MINIVLLEPEIPQNTGNIARTCAVTGSRLHIVGPIPFDISDRAARRAGLDYWKDVEVLYYPSREAFFRQHPQEDGYFFTTKAERNHCQMEYGPEPWLFFGRESSGIPEEILVEHRERCVRIPMRPQERSLNLSNSVAIAVYEVLRQKDFAGLEQQGKLHHLEWKE
ncbi:MAG: tRNA (cytidine(34)-2'-O)-methyltransferase [Eubacteriales bacterium]|jgi:tRNA (cytidine/uridine-2'-O-)-methyltransferase